jgi:hypothetical protein
MPGYSFFYAGHIMTQRLIKSIPSKPFLKNESWQKIYLFLLTCHSCVQAWKLKEENRLLELVDSEITDYDENEVYRFLVVALFCTQSTAQHRPTMKQVLQMLSKQVHLNEKALTEPGIYRWNTSIKRRSSFNETPLPSSQVTKHKNYENQHQTSTHYSGTDIVTEVFPR